MRWIVARRRLMLSMKNFARPTYWRTCCFSSSVVSLLRSFELEGRVDRSHAQAEPPGLDDLDGQLVVDHPDQDVGANDAFASRRRSPPP